MLTLEQVRQLVAVEGWTFLGVFQNPPPAPPGMVTEVREDGFLGIATHYRFVPTDTASANSNVQSGVPETLAFVVLLFLVAPPIAALVMIGMF